ncbi:NAD-dependent epimerase/dehydratase family protein [Aliiruegeria lutimaris]|uniref:NAD dependent epimerase/dehydratase family protein n=1 Tax=Aliiruegeria lutimaris TaxID=571298 RepID=A0A1G9D6B8_9RHOB|nr:NAD(P)-dependent oxidoreductase [Aliiruegeria lutimaris]SDK59401.1 NAD dependent epimerase/dehydratase family protein [Aliiruegeria lutimaris]
MKILVTGASGHVAQMGLAKIAERHDLLLTDRACPKSLPDSTCFAECDLLRDEDDKLAELFHGVEVVIHSAYIHSSEKGDVYGLEPPQIDRFDTEMDNIRIAQRVYRSAYDAGVRRVVMVSSNHACDWYEHSQVHSRRRELITESDYPLSDNFYGWAKASYELLGFPYACGSFGRKLEVVHLRIGSPYSINAEKFLATGATQTTSLPKPTGVAGFKRALGAYLSPHDCAELFRAAAESPEIEGIDGVPWLVVFGISDNTRAFWSLETARSKLGYTPRDDSELLYADDIDRVLRSGRCSGRVGI